MKSATDSAVGSPLAGGASGPGTGKPEQGGADGMEAALTYCWGPGAGESEHGRTEGLLACSTVLTSEAPDWSSSAPTSFDHQSEHD
jgi:hypothetical protein